MTKIVTPEVHRLMYVLLDTLQEFKDPFLSRVAKNVADGTVPIGTKLGIDAEAVVRLGTIRALELLAKPTDDGAIELLVSEQDFSTTHGPIGQKGWYTTTERDSLFLSVMGYMPNEKSMRTFEAAYFFRPCDVVGQLEFDE